MDQEAPIASSEPPAAEASQDSSDLASSLKEVKLLDQIAGGSWLGVLVASGLYPMMFLLVMLMALLVSGGGDIPEILGRVAAVAAIGGICSVPYLIAMALHISIVFVLVAKICETLRLKPSMATFSAFVGGLAGFLAAFLPFAISRHPSRGLLPYEIFGMVIYLVLGPCLATLMGQIGGAWGTMGHYREEPPRSRFQFNLRQMLILTAWVSVLLTLLRLTGLLTWLPMLILAIWVVYQAATLWVVLRLVKPLAAWWGGGK